MTISAFPNFVQVEIKFEKDNELTRALVDLYLQGHGWLIYDVKAKTSILRLSRPALDYVTKYVLPKFIKIKKLRVYPPPRTSFFDDLLLVVKRH